MFWKERREMHKNVHTSKHLLLLSLLFRALS